jgi:uncharacterized protein (TIGR02271 family)
MAHTNTNRQNPGQNYGYSNIPNDLTRMSRLDQYDVAEDDIDPRGWDVMGSDGEKIGTIKDLIASPSDERVYFAVVDTGGMFQNKESCIPLEQVRLDSATHRAYAPYFREQFRNAPGWNEGSGDYRSHYQYWSGFHTTGTPQGRTTNTDMTDQEIRMPLAEETAQVRKEKRQAGFVTLRKRVETETKHISEPLTHTRVEVEMRDVPAGAAYTGEHAATLEPGETLRVPVEKEELVVEKNAQVTREAVLHRQAETHQEERDIELRREVVDVDEDSDVTAERPVAGRRNV